MLIVLSDTPYATRTNVGFMPLKLPKESSYQLAKWYDLEAPLCTRIRPSKSVWDEVFLLWTPLDLAKQPVICNGLDGTKLDRMRRKLDHLRIATDCWRGIKLWNEKAAASTKDREANGEGYEASAG